MFRKLFGRDHGARFLAHASKGKRRRSSLQIESLESRYAPACNLYAGDLVSCDGADDAIELYNISGGPTHVYSGPDFIGRASGNRILVNGGPGANSLRVTDPGFPSGDTYTLHSVAPQVRIWGRNFTVGFGNINALELQTSSGPDTINVERLLWGATTRVFAGPGNDTINLGSANSLDWIHSPLTLDGQEGTDVLNVNDQQDPNANNYYLSGGPELRFQRRALGFTDNPVNVTHLQFESVVVNASAYSDTIDIPSTSASVTINAGAGNDVVRVAYLSGDLVNLAGSVAVNGQGGTDSLTLHDDNQGGSHTYAVTAALVQRPGAARVSYSTLESLTVRVGWGNSSFQILSTLAGCSTTIYAGSGNNTFNLGSTDSLDWLHGPLTLDGQGGTDVLNVNDQQDPNANNYYLPGGLTPLVQRRALGFTDNPVNVTHFRFESVVVNASAYSDTIDIPSTDAPLTVNAGAGNDVVRVAYLSGDLVNLAGSVTVNGQGGSDSLTVRDDNQGGSHPYTVTAAWVERPGAARVSYSTLESLTVSAGWGNNSFQVLSSLAGCSTTINAGSGNNAIRVTDLSGDLLNLGGPLTVNGQGGTDSLTVRDDNQGSGHPYTVTAASVERPGAARVSYSALESLTVRVGWGNSSFQVLSTLVGCSTAIYAGSGNNTIALSPAAIAGSLRVDGQGGTNRLSYSAYASNVTVNLPLGLATDVTGGIANIHNVTGGAGNDVLVGDLNSNVLEGGAGHDLLIAGGFDYRTGALPRLPDTLRGGDGEDMLLAGATIWETFAPEVLGILRDIWALTTLPFETRRDYLLPLFDPALYFSLSNYAANTLEGGTGDDWFFANDTPGRDQFPDLTPLERSRLVRL